MNWDEYNWYFDKSKAPSNTVDTSTTNPWETSSLVCVGSQCCTENTLYDDTLNKCIFNPYNLSKDTNSPGSDLDGMPVKNSSVSSCMNLCNTNDSCSGFVIDNGNNDCWLKNNTGNHVATPGIDLYTSRDRKF
jgi:hypothetical protein